MGISEVEEEEKGAEEAFETTMTEDFHKLMSDTAPQIQGAQRTPSRIKVKKVTPRHLIPKLQKIKDKEKILKQARGKTNTLPIEGPRQELHPTYPQKPCRQEESGIPYLKC